MKRTIKKTPPLTETQIETEENKGKTISIYLNAEALKWLDQLCNEWGMTKKVKGRIVPGRSEALQTMLIMWKKMTKSLNALLEQEKLSVELNKILKPR